MIPRQRKILIITNRIPFPLKDGGNLAMNAMIEGYHRAGWQVYVLSMNTTRHPIANDVLQTLYRQIYRFEWVDIDNRITALGVIGNFFFSKQPEHAARFYSKEFESRITGALAAFKPDVVQAESVYLASYLPAIAAASGALTVLRMHNVEYQIWQGLAKKSSYIKKLYLENLAVRVRNYERRAWLNFDMLLPITEKDANLVVRIEDVNSMIVAPFAIDLNKVKPGKNEQWVGYHIGAMDWMANQEGITWFLDKVWKKIRKAAPDFEFYFAGRSMPERFRHISLPGVHCMSEVPSADDFIADKKILIVPLLSGGGIRVKILEAMAAGKVVIATRQGIKGLEAQPGEHFLQASTPDEFARSVKWCIENKEAAEKMARNATALICEKYESSAVMKIVIAGIEAMLDERAGA